MPQNITTGTKLHAREPELDILRGIAILLAMGWHFNNQEVSTLAAVLLWPGAQFGWAGVDLFFVLSGFLVGGLLLREFDRYGRIDFKRFFIRRVFRLWPVLYLFLFAMLASGVAPARDFFWQTALHVQNYAGVKSATHLWSLAVEEHFYLLLAGLFALLSGAAGRWNLLRVILIAIVIVSPVMRWIGWTAGAEPNAIQIQTHYRLDGMAIGVLLALMLHHQPSIYNAIQKKKFTLLITILSAIVAITCNEKYSLIGATIGYSCAAIGSAAALLIFHQSGIDKGLRWIGNALIFLGFVSYPLYLWHVPVGKIFEKISVRFNLSEEIIVLGQYSLSIFVAWIASKALERPFINLRDRMFPTVGSVGAKSSISSSKPQKS